MLAMMVGVTTGVIGLGSYVYATKGDIEAAEESLGTHEKLEGHTMIVYKNSQLKKDVVTAQTSIKSMSEAINDMKFNLGLIGVKLGVTNMKK